MFRVEGFEGLFFFRIRESMVQSLNNFLLFSLPWQHSRTERHRSCSPGS